MNLLDIIAYLKDPNRTQQVQGLGGLLEDTLSNMQRKSQYATNVMEKALPDPSNLGKVGDRGAYKEAANMAFDALSFAPAGLTVYHGSPAKFTQFDASKIGSGEGAQAYGYGHYVAENPGVAQDYADILGGTAIKDKVGNKFVNTGEYDTAISYAKKFANEKEPFLSAENAIKDKIKSGQADNIFDLANSIKQLRMFKENGYSIQKDGNLYTIDLPDEQIARMLDWDKPLSEQPLIMDFINRQEVARTKSVLDQRLQTLKNLDENSPNAATLKRQIEILREEISDPQASGLGSMTGGEYYNYLRRRDMPPDKQAEMFRNAGIPGIRYLDQGSRGVGEGTRNFVVFPGNEGLLTIQKRNNEVIAPKGLLDYRIEHRPMTVEGGASRLHDAGTVFGEDVYGKNALQYFGSGLSGEKTSLDILKKVRGNPDAEITIYRGVPEGVNAINKGDWVTLDPKMAEEYGNVISKKVKAKDITTWPDSLVEFGYYPD